MYLICAIPCHTHQLGLEGYTSLTSTTRRLTSLCTLPCHASHPILHLSPCCTSPFMNLVPLFTPHCYASYHIPLFYMKLLFISKPNNMCTCFITRTEIFKGVPHLLFNHMVNKELSLSLLYIFKWLAIYTLLYMILFIITVMVFITYYIMYAVIALFNLFFILLQYSLRF